MEYNVMLVGNPNVGKTSLYNRITKSFEHVGNWHGVTVSSVSKKILFEGKIINVTDLPGLYSLTAYSPEEGISRDRILSSNDDLIINVCECGNLSRNLYLMLQLLEAGKRIMLAINMIDELKKCGKTINSTVLEKRLGLKIVLCSAKYKNDAKALINNAIEQLTDKHTCTPKLDHLAKLPINNIASIINTNAIQAGFDAKWAAVKILEKDEYIFSKLALSNEQKQKLASFDDMQSDVAKARYDYVDLLLKDLFADIKSKNKTTSYVHGKSRIDKIVLNKYFALPIFLCVLAVIFFITFGLVGKWLSVLLDWLIENALYNPVNRSLDNINCPKWISALLCEGVINGVGGILTFLPQVVLLFFFLALLEDSGYISRVAFMTDGLFKKIGLTGRSSFSMLMGFGCSATAVLTSRGLEDEAMRKKTIMLTPFFSCSARLPVYSVIAAAFFSKGQPLIIFGMYLLGIAVALALAAIFEKLNTKLKSGQLTFIMEMPPYRLPTFERVIQIISNNIKVFIVRVGTVIFALNVIVWVLSNFSLVGGFVADTGCKSIFETTGTVLAPLFSPLGFGSWKAVTALLSGIVAKESVIASIGSLGGVGEVFVGTYAKLSALSFMIFTLLYVPCIATLAAIKKETSIRFMLLCVLIQFLAAYFCSLAFYQVGRLFVANVGLAIGITLALIIALITILSLISFVKKRRRCAHNCYLCDKGCTK